MPDFDLTRLDAAAMRALSGEELVHLVTLGLEEQQRRALEAGDVEALVEEGFAQGFSSKGEARSPWMVGGLLVCPGAKADRSALSHDCTFVVVDDTWVWDSEAKVYDEVRTPPGPRHTMRTVTVVLPHEGMKVDVVSSKLKMGVHEMKSVKSYAVKNGELEAVTTRTPRADRHR